MRSYRLNGDTLSLADSPEPEATGSQIVVRVHAAALNKRDTLILDGVYPLPHRDGLIPISDGAGEVVAVGPKATRFKVGDRVMGSYWPRWHDGRLRPELIDQLGCTVDGMLTELAVLDEQWAVRVPDHLSWEEAATLPCAALTAWSALTGGEPLLPGQQVLTLGTGGVSLFALQLAQTFGARVTVTTSSDAKIDRLKALGAEHVVNYATEPAWGERVRALTGGADLVVETVGKGTLDQSVRATALYGHVVLIGAMAGGGGVEVAGATFANSLATIRRVFVGHRTGLEQLSAAVAQSGIRPVIDRVYGFDEALDAISYYRTASPFGKVVIRTAP
ncbi:NAD(P)-dependent alcohol dehydrogenase [Nonomuraea sp. NPDC050556]|uniref:NAD(P)-dependent alcohol dehydrogenase n=1 Tax=Nonomuraea sp. NPDC050556 TaxID=3364369 RepID=UPI0037B8ABC1